MHKPIPAELAGSDVASALGITVIATSFVIALCRALVEYGYDPALSLAACPDGMPCLHVRSIGEAVNWSGRAALYELQIGSQP